VIREWPVPPESLAQLVALIDAGRISGRIAKEVFEKMLDTGGAPEEIVRRENLEQVSDEAAIAAAVDAVLAQHAAQVEEYRAGREKLFGFFVGQVMKATKGKANPALVNAKALTPPGRRCPARAPGRDGPCTGSPAGRRGSRRRPRGCDRRSPALRCDRRS
jgi:Asp-tRNA(Asn)/Glu-tRNA(Gln) amidotransferase B subunit